MKHSGPTYLAWLGIGLLLGGTTRLAVSASKTAPTPDKNPNVVILRGEKMVSLDKDDIPLTELAASFSKQSGYALTLDEAYTEDKTPYHVLFSHVPLTRALSAIGYLAHGRWERTERGYHLKQLTGAERATDIARYEGAVERARQYLSQTNLDDPSLSAVQHDMIQSWLMGANARLNDLAPFPVAALGATTVTVSDHGLSIAYAEQTDDGKNHSRAEWWSWK